MRYDKVLILTPPFYSHFNPLLSLALGFHAAGSEVIVAAAEPFMADVQAAGLRAARLDINRNANTGVAQQTQQARPESERLAAFFQATREGPIATLRLQSEHRQADMLTDPERLRQDIATLAEREQPDVFIVDQLSYAATLALTCLDLPFVTFCPGHPTYIPTGDQLFGVPYAWPCEFDISGEQRAALRAIATETDRRFTRIFNETLATCAPAQPPIKSAFRVASPHIWIFNYPDFGHLHREETGIHKVFMGYAFEEAALPAPWQQRLSKIANLSPTVMITMGTFLSARNDVLDRCIQGVKRALPESAVIVSAGANVEKLARWRAQGVIVERFLPQKALLPHVDLVIFHGGNNTFTETLFYGKPMLILPFSSDQFSIARDAQAHALAGVLDPNRFTEVEMAERLAFLLRDPAPQAACAHWQRHVQARGPTYAARRLIAEA